MVAFATQVKRRRGTTAQNDAFTGAEGEIVVDVQKHTLRVHDGATQGGFEMAKQADLDNKADTSYINDQLLSKADTDLGNIPANYDYVVESQLPTADNGYTWYRKYKSGWVEQGGYVEGAGSPVEVALPIHMNNTDYGAQMTPAANSTGTNPRVYVSKTTLTTTSIRLVFGSYQDGQYKAYWQVSGMSAQ